MGGQEKKTTVSTLDEGYKLIEDFVRRFPDGGYNYAILSQENETITVTEKTSKPCYGELRPYKSEIVSNIRSQIERAKDYHPGDLPHKFPVGEIHAIGVPFSGSGRLSAGYQLFLDPENSPWRAALVGAEVIKNPVGVPLGLIQRNTDIGPSLLINMLMVLRYWTDLKGSKFDALRKLRPDQNPNIALLATLLGGYVTGSGLNVTHAYAYSLKTNHMSVPAFVHGQPYDIDGGAVLRFRAAYNRPWINDCFGHGHKNSLTAGLTFSEAEMGKFLDIIEQDAEQAIPAEMSGTGVDIIASCGDRINAG